MQKKLNETAQQNFAPANINIKSEIGLNLRKLRQCLSNASEISFAE